MREEKISLTRSVAGKGVRKAQQALVQEAAGLRRQMVGGRGKKDRGRKRRTSYTY
jgi:hypothetical protein